MLKWLELAIKEDHIREIDYKDFRDKQPIARGASSEISRAYWSSAEKTVALKALIDNPACGSGESFESFVKELKFTRHLNFCDHIIRFYGVSCDPSEQSCLNALKKPTKNRSNSPNNIGTPITPPLGQMNANIAKMSINDPNRLNANYNNNIHRQPGQPGCASNANQLNNFVQGNNQVNPQLQRSPILANNSPQKIGQNPIPANNPLQNVGQNQIPANNPPQNIGQNPMPLNIPRNIHQNPMLANNSPQNIGQNPMPANNSPQNIGQNPMPANKSPQNIGQNPIPPNIPRNVHQNPMPANNSPQNIGQNPMPANNSPQNIGQNPMPVNIPGNYPAQNFIVPNQTPVNGHGHNFAGQVNHNNFVSQNQMQVNPGQNFVDQKFQIPANHPSKNHLPNVVQNQPSHLTQQQLPVNNLDHNAINARQQFHGNNVKPNSFPPSNQNPIGQIPTQSAPVPHAINQQFIPGINQQFLGQNMRASPNNANNFRPGSGGNPQNINRQGMNPQLQQNPPVQPFTQPIPNIPSQNITPNIASNGAPNFIPNSGGQVASGFQHHQFNNQTPNIASNPSVQMQQPLNSNFSGPQDASPLSSGEKTQFQNSNGPTTPSRKSTEPLPAQDQTRPIPHKALSDSSAYLTTNIFDECPLINQCQNVMEEYENKYRNELGYEKPTKCHAGYHAGFGDTEGLRHHFNYGAKPNGFSRFLTVRDRLVIIAAKYCSRRKMIEIFKVLKEFKADFKYSNNNQKNALHCLFENISLTRDLKDHKALEKFHRYINEAIVFLVDNGCNINSTDNSNHTILSYYLCDKFRHKEYAPIILMLLKKGANPNIRVTMPQQYNAPNALFLAIKMGWPIEILDALLNSGARGDIKDDNKENILVLAAREKQPSTIDWILEKIPEASTGDSIEAAMKLSDRKDRNKLSKWKGSSGEIRRRLVQENLELKKQLRTETENIKEINYESDSD
ncbi:2206_t:CDS:2 [Scutellospora calospora]|uniref:2206_t:CDS:1 n=1 Tax=Scutellospora calospora TaxID=85575 RepID=A0ACA9K3Z4_9GLOM|nr:2206_t:CDS:2 [Scutellospora calospora]